MPKGRTTAESAEEMQAFGRRLVDLLVAAGQDRHGAGKYLADRYRVSTVTANAWLNGTHRPSTARARRIAEDHGSTFDELYFGRAPTHVREGNVRYMPRLELSAREHEFIEKYRVIDDAGRDMLDRLAQSLLLDTLMPVRDSVQD